MPRTLFNYFRKTRLSQYQQRRSTIKRTSRYTMPHGEGLTDLQKLQASKGAATPMEEDETEKLSQWETFKKKSNQMMDGGIWIIISIVCTIISLFAYDFTIWALPKQCDLSTDIILLIVFIFFAVELVLLILCRSDYLWSYWFYLDILAFVSMIPDLTLLLEAMSIDPAAVNVSNTRASKAGKSARSTALLKMVRMIRFSRLLRVLRAFRFFQSDDGTRRQDGTEMENEQLVDAGSSKVGQIVSEAVTKKVVLLVLIMVLALPWFEPSGNSFSDAAMSASDLYAYTLINNGGSISENELYSILEDVGAPILYIKDHVNDVVYRNKNKKMRRRRKQMEIWKYEDKTGSVTFKFDIRSQVQEEAGLGMLLTLFSIMIFTGSTIFVNSSVLELVVEPITRLTQLLMRMAGVIGLMGGAETFENLLAQNNELFVVEALCGRIAMVFGGDGPRHTMTIGMGGRAEKKKKGIMGKGLSMFGGMMGQSSQTPRDRLKQEQLARRAHARQSLFLLKNGQKSKLPEAVVLDTENDGKEVKKDNSKALNLMATSRTTHITNDDRVMEVKITERHRWSFVSNQVTQKFKEFQRIKNSPTGDALDLEQIQAMMEDATELKSMHTVVDNAVLCYLLRLYMTSNLTLNNLLFILRVRHWKNMIQETFTDLYNTFCDDKSPAQINVSHKLFKEMDKTLEGTDSITEDVFNRAYEETWHLLETNIHRQFVESDYGMFYCHLKSSDPSTFNQLQTTAAALQKEENEKVGSSS